MTRFCGVEEAVSAFQAGRPIIIIDDEDRENEGDIVIAAEKTTPAWINFMARQACGLICLAITRQRADQLDLPLMVNNNNALHETAFTVSIDSVAGTTTGISAADRSKTILDVVDDRKQAADFARPGHIFPLIAQDKGVLVRRGHTEAGVDLAKLAGLYPAAVICEIINEDGTMARVPDLIRYAAKHDMPILTIDHLVQYIASNQPAIVAS